MPPEVRNTRGLLHPGARERNPVPALSQVGGWAGVPGTLPLSSCQLLCLVGPGSLGGAWGAPHGLSVPGVLWDPGCLSPRSQGLEIPSPTLCSWLAGEGGQGLPGCNMHWLITGRQKLAAQIFQPLQGCPREEKLSVSLMRVLDESSWRRRVVSVC